MTTRMAALLLLRRLAAGGAVARLQQPYAGLATAAARHDALDATGEESGRPDKGNKNRWMELPPFAPVDAAAAARAIFRGQGGDEIEGSSNSTAIRWVRRCCPHLPASLVQKLFRLRKLRVHCAEVLGTPIVGDYKYGRQAHQDWTPLPVPQTVDEELLRKQRLPFGLVLGGGSVAEQQPQLHLHCKQMMLPDISAAVQGLQSEDADRDFSDLEKLSFVAPLPLHMRLSWEVLKSTDK